MGKQQPANPRTCPGGTQPPAGTAQCPAQIRYTLTGRWLDTQAYCGDEARLEVTVTPTPPDGLVTVNVLHPTTGATVDTLTGNMTGGRMETKWITKAQTANWRTDRIPFSATASSVGVSGNSTNQLTFRQRPTTTWTLINVAHPSGNSFGPVHQKHDAQLEADKVHYKLKLKLRGSAFSEAKRTAAKQVIEDVWNNGFSAKNFHRTDCKRGDACDCTFDCCKAGFQLEVEFVTTGQHLTVRVVRTRPGRRRQRSSMNGNRGTWGDPPMNADTTYAHETGHVLGQFDEYSTGAIDPGASPDQPSNAATPNLMSTSGNTTLLNRHYRHVLKYLNDNASGDSYEIIPSGE